MLWMPSDWTTLSYLHFRGPSNSSLVLCRFVRICGLSLLSAFAGTFKFQSGPVPACPGRLRCMSFLWGFPQPLGYSLLSAFAVTFKFQSGIVPACPGRAPLHVFPVGGSPTFGSVGTCLACWALSGCGGIVGLAAFVNFHRLKLSLSFLLCASASFCFLNLLLY